MPALYKPPSLWYYSKTGSEQVENSYYSPTLCCFYNIFFCSQPQRIIRGTWLPAPSSWSFLHFPPYLGPPHLFRLRDTGLSPQMSAKDDSWQSLLPQSLASPLGWGHFSARWTMKPKPGNETGISWFRERGQLRSEKLSENIGLLSLLPRAAFGQMLASLSKPCLIAQQLAYVVSLYELENCAPLKADNR